MPDNNCVPASDYAGFQADTVNTLLSQCPGTVPVGAGCRVTNCNSSVPGNTACTTCDVANNFYLLWGVCYAYASIPDGYGIVTTGVQTLQACADTNCVKCVADRTNCTLCNEPLGYVLVNGTCHKLTIITTAVRSNKPDVDLSWKQQIADTPIPVNTSKVYKTLTQKKDQYKLTADDKSDLGSYSFTIENYEQYVMVDFALPKGLPKEQYNVSLQGFNFTLVDSANLTVFVLPGNSVHNNILANGMLLNVGSVQGLTSTLTTTVAAPDSAGHRPHRNIL
jgi:hypothetical protein